MPTLLVKGVRVALGQSGQREVLLWLHDRGCPVLTGSVLRAAAAARQLDTLVWLLGMCGCGFKERRGPAWDEDYLGALEAAAEVGRQDVCAWLLAHGWGWGMAAAAAAARQGHVQLLHWLLQRRPPAPPPAAAPPAAAAAAGAGAAGAGAAAAWADGGASTRQAAQLRSAEQLLAAAAWGCSLTQFQRLYEGEGLHGPGALLDQQQQQQALLGGGPASEGAEAAAAQARFRDTVLAAAVASPQPDWRDRAAWLLAPPRSYQVTWGVLCGVMATVQRDEEAVERLAFLQSHWREHLGPPLREDGSADWQRLAQAAVGRGFAQALGWVTRMRLQQQGQQGQQLLREPREAGGKEGPGPQLLAAPEVVATAVTQNQVACLQALEAAGADVAAALRLGVEAARPDVVRWALAGAAAAAAAAPSGAASGQGGGRHCRRGSVSAELLATAAASQNAAIFRALWRHLQRLETGPGGAAEGADKAAAGSSTDSGHGSSTDSGHGSSTDSGHGSSASDCGKGLLAAMHAEAQQRLRSRPHLREWLRQQVEQLEGRAGEWATGAGSEDGGGSGDTSDEELAGLLQEEEEEEARRRRRHWGAEAGALAEEVGASRVLICTVS
ncbi:hypothetical protein HYH02_012750 [Chlamydomonas schloesseri]|uniref:Uncharacterized protein n=1 Tax=Chlamydomonas schloesseri TaxID=2026947 RepID=A0A835SU24_9CHLO|nr:hypothetical protein HYH02_012750 [Chlamydomonas schloesseri]|eukprot:KAG2433209.1 hypothetical protein HYH02_012750 [Chlamydomonas schloesseri]